ncbi:MAG: glycosyltransferase [Candidatus Sumerlaeia bacterium]|nr:glycosyltransferase [Candidatus Sumerlaeia bacterium]
MPAIKNDTPEVTVVLPYRNASTTLPRAIGSILNQSLSALELLLIDDKSSDNSPHICREYAATDSRIHLLDSPEPHGLVAALNHGISEARAPWIARMDADDISLPNRLQRQWIYMKEHRELQACGCGIEIIPDPDDPNARVAGGFLRYRDWLNELVEPEAIHRERFIESPIAHPTAFYSRAAIIKAGSYRDTPWAEDYDLWLRLLEGGTVIGKVPEILLHWSDPPNRLTRTAPRYHNHQFLAAKGHFLARLPGVGQKRLHICGAGPTGKRLARILRRLDIQTHAFHDVHPRRIGQTIQGAPVLPHDSFPPAGETVLLAAIGQPESRPPVRSLARSAGYVEGCDFFVIS